MVSSQITNAGKSGLEKLFLVVVLKTLQDKVPVEIDLVPELLLEANWNSTDHVYRLSLSPISSDVVVDNTEGHVSDLGFGSERFGESKQAGVQ